MAPFCKDSQAGRITKHCALLVPKVPFLSGPATGCQVPSVDSLSAMHEAAAESRRSERARSEIYSGHKSALGWKAMSLGRGGGGRYLFTISVPRSQAAQPLCMSLSFPRPSTNRSPQHCSLLLSLPLTWAGLSPWHLPFRTECSWACPTLPNSPHLSTLCVWVAAGAEQP